MPGRFRNLRATVQRRDRYDMDAVMSKWTCPRAALPLWLGASLAATLACGAAQERKATMTTPGVGSDQMLSANLIPSISDSSTSLVVARITGLRLARQSGSDAEVETGRVSLNVVAVIRSFTLVVASS